ncbi:MAG: hypothetical protein K0V04_09015 [Deltaproteobacteria bacterium]|nr:hypothetical protein [Deltaproteobacteria bacterium]
MRPGPVAPAGWLARGPQRFGDAGPDRARQNPQAAGDDGLDLDVIVAPGAVSPVDAGLQCT